MSDRKIFAGGRVRAVRTLNKLTQRQLAEKLGISTSYLNQIENNQRPLTAAIMLELAENFELDISEFASDRPDRLLADLREVLADPLFGDTAPGIMELKALITNAPDTAQAMLRLYEAYRKSNEQLASIDARMSDALGGPQTAYEEVRDFFHYAGNYFDALDRAAENVAGEIGPALQGRLNRLISYVELTHDVRVLFTEHDRPEAIRSFDRTRRIISINARISHESQFFQLAAQLGLMEQASLIDEITVQAGFTVPEAHDICRLGLANYFAGALQMPYASFLNAAEDALYDLDELSFQFGASMEQVAHRFSTLQRPKARGVPFFFARLDAAGTITKRHSATPLQFARFGGACPLWNVHRAFEANDHIARQLAETPDGKRYLSLAWHSEKRSGGYRSPVRRYAYALGCEVLHADRLIYGRDLDLTSETAYEPIGVSCRICERTDCAQRSVPPIASTISIGADSRDVVPYRIG